MTTYYPKIVDINVLHERFGQPEYDTVRDTAQKTGLQLSGKETPVLGMPLERIDRKM